jgi:DNA-directed RNA polymerase subunit RPC12/RpoP
MANPEWHGPQDMTDEEFQEYYQEMLQDLRRRNALKHTHACIRCGTQVDGLELVQGYGCRGCGGTDFVKLRTDDSAP